MMYLERWKSSRWLRVPPEWLDDGMGWKHIFQYRDVTGLSPESSYYIGTGPVREARCMVCLAPDTTAPRLASPTLHHPVPQSLHYHHYRIHLQTCPSWAFIPGNTPRHYLSRILNQAIHGNRDPAEVQQYPTRRRR